MICQVCHRGALDVKRARSITIVIDDDVAPLVAADGGSDLVDVECDNCGFNGKMRLEDGDE